jgi:hypothetical protein
LCSASSCLYGIDKQRTKKVNGISKNEKNDDYDGDDGRKELKKD